MLNHDSKVLICRLDSNGNIKKILTITNSNFMFVNYKGYVARNCHVNLGMIHILSRNLNFGDIRYLDIHTKKDITSAVLSKNWFARSIHNKDFLKKLIENKRINLHRMDMIISKVIKENDDFYSFCIVPEGITRYLMELLKFLGEDISSPRFLARSIYNIPRRPLFNKAVNSLRVCDVKAMRNQVGFYIKSQESHTDMKLRWPFTFGTFITKEELKNTSYGDKFND